MSLRTSSTQGASGQVDILPLTKTLVEFLTNPLVDGFEPILQGGENDSALGRRIIEFVGSDDNQFPEKLTLFTQLVLDALDLVEKHDGKVLGTLIRLSRDAISPEAIPPYARPVELVWEQVQLAVANHTAVLALEEGQYVLNVVVAQVWSGHTFQLAEVEYDQRRGFFGKPPQQDNPI